MLLRRLERLRLEVVPSLLRLQVLSLLLHRLYVLLLPILRLLLLLLVVLLAVGH